MKKPRPKSCKVCEEKYQPDRPLTEVCGVKCAIELVKIKQQKKEDAAHRERKREFKQNDVKVRKAAAKKACHAYIRERDKNKPCICCDAPLSANYHAGHWLESGNNPKIRYDERNISAQNLNCNYFKGGDSGNYEKNLRIRIGDKNVDELLSMKGGVMKRTAQDYKDIETHYREKLKNLV